MQIGLERLLIGRALTGRYVLEEVLGRGGMSVVFRGRDRTLERAVAVKLILLPGESEEMRGSLRRRFRREAGAAARIPPHPHVVRVYDYGTDAELDLDFIVMELLEGRDLAAALAGGPLPVRKGVRAVLEAASGIAAGHRAGIVHRDIKPGNIFLTEPEGGAVRVLDFGIAKVLEAEGEEDLTIFGHQPHSPAYASPEQLDPDRPLSAASDVYQLGLVACEVMTGRKPFTPEQRDRIRAGERVPLPGGDEWADVPPPLRRVIERAVHPHPAGRFADAGAFADAWRSAVDEITALRGALPLLSPDEPFGAAARGDSGSPEVAGGEGGVAGAAGPGSARRYGSTARPEGPADPGDETLYAVNHRGEEHAADETLFAPGVTPNADADDWTMVAPDADSGPETEGRTLFASPPGEIAASEVHAPRRPARRSGRVVGVARPLVGAVLVAVVVMGTVWGASRLLGSGGSGQESVDLELEASFRDLESEASRRLEREGFWER